MLKAAEDLNFEEAARIRDEIKRLNETSLIFNENPMAKLQNFIKKDDANNSQKINETWGSSCYRRGETNRQRNN